MVGVVAPLRYLEEFTIGETESTTWISANKADMVAFAKVWDPMPIHVDDDAATASIFGGITGSSVYTWGLKQLLVKHLINQDAVICMLGFDEGRLPAALHADRNVRLEANWLGQRRSVSRPDTGILRFRLRLLTDQNEVVLDYIENLLMHTRPRQDGT